MNTAQPANMFPYSSQPVHKPNVPRLPSLNQFVAQLNTNVNQNLLGGQITSNQYSMMPRTNVQSQIQPNLVTQNIPNQVAYTTPAQVYTQR